MSKPTSIRLDDVRPELEEIKKVFGLVGTHGEDTIAIKKAIIFTKNVLHNFFGDDLARVFTHTTRKEIKEKKIIS